METGGREKKPIRLNICNHTISLVTSEDPAELEALAHSVDELIQGIAARSGNVELTRVAILACLHLADQLRTTERELASLKHRVNEKVERLGGLLDQVIE